MHYLLIEANDCYKVYNKLNDYRKDYLEILNLSPSFFTIVLYSLENTFMMALAKLFDSDKTTLSLHKILNICENNQKLFKKELTFPFYEGGTDKIVDNEIIKVNLIEDIKKTRLEISSLEKSISSLKGRRDKKYAHNDKQYIDKLTELADKYPLNHHDIESLIECAGKILNRLLNDLNGEVMLTYHSNYGDIDEIIKILILNR